MRPRPLLLPARALDLPPRALGVDLEAHEELVICGDRGAVLVNSR